MSDAIAQFMFNQYITEWALKVPYYTIFHQYIIGLRYIQNMSLKCLAPNTKQIIAALPIIPSVSALFQKC